MESGVQTGTAQAAVYEYIARDRPGRVRGRVAPMRDGALTVTHDGVLFAGKGMYGPGKQALCLVFGSCFSLLIAAILLDYVLREDRRASIDWSAIDEVILEPQAGRACIVYREAGGRDHSFAFRLEPYQFGHFEQVMQYFAAGKVRYGMIGSFWPLWARVLATTPAVVAVTVVVLMIVAEMSGR